MRLLTLILFLAMIGCGPSEQEINNIAKVTCNVMGESRNMDAAFRLKEINTAREQIGAEPYLGGDDGIKESFEWGECEALVKADPEYAATLAEHKRRYAEEARIAEEKKAEERKIAEEKRRAAAEAAEELRKAKNAEYRSAVLEIVGQSRGPSVDDFEYGNSFISGEVTCPDK